MFVHLMRFLLNPFTNLHLRNLITEASNELETSILVAYILEYICSQEIHYNFHSHFSMCEQLIIIKELENIKLTKIFLLFILRFHLFFLRIPVYSPFTDIESLLLISRIFRSPKAIKHRRIFAYNS